MAAAVQPLVAASVVKLVERMRAATGIEAFLDTPVLVPVSAEHTEVNELDHLIGAELRFLEEVCMRPQDRLGSEHVLVRAETARRVPAAGLTRLSSRTEDWAGLDGAGRIIPKRLLAQRHVEDYDFYENRIAAQLVDRLRGYLSERIAALTALDRHVQDLDRFESALRAPQSHWKRKRQAHLLDEATKHLEEHSVAIQDALDVLGPMLESVNRLRSSPLYRRADRSVRLPFRLPRTNLLQGNYFYHRVAALWEAWALRESGEVALRTRNDRAFDSAYGMYVAAIVVRALGVLGIPLTGIERSAESPTSFVLQGADGERLELRVRNSVPAELFVGERKALQFIALPQDLSAHLSTDDFERTVHEVVPAGKEGIPTLVLYPGLLSGREQLPAHFRRLVHWTGPVPRGAALPADLVGIIPVTPLEIESTERAARALRWVLYGQSLLSGYPQRIPVPDWLVVEAADWIHRESDALRIVRKPTEAQLRQTESDIDHLHGLQPRRFGNRTEPTATGPLKQALRQAAKVLGRLATCPMCGEDRDVRFEPWESGAFRCLCRDCKGEWGTRTCVSCGNFPILLANGAGFQAALGHPEHGDDIDSAFGSELLAVPCPTDPDGNQFQCPRCGICQNAPRCDCGSTSTPTIAGDGAE